MFSIHKKLESELLPATVCERNRFTDIFNECLLLTVTLDDCITREFRIP